MLLMRQAIGIFVLCAKSVANETLPCRPLAPRSLPTCGLFLSFLSLFFSLYFSIFSHCPVLLANIQSKLRRVGLFNAQQRSLGTRLRFIRLQNMGKARPSLCSLQSVVVHDLCPV